MTAALTEMVLVRENRRFQGSGGRSPENRVHGFRPAFMDTDTHMVYPSCFADGRPAPFHILDGLPDQVVRSGHASGRVAAVKLSVVSGFVRDGRFFTREEAAMMVSRARAAGE